MRGQGIVVLGLSVWLIEGCSDKAEHAGWEASTPASASAEAGAPASLDARAASSSELANNGLHDAGVVHIDSGFVCAHRHPQSGLCDDPNFVAMCATVARESDCVSFGCSPFRAEQFDVVVGCYGSATFLSCGLTPDGCSTVVTYGRSSDGSVWRFSDSCQPSGFTRVGSAAAPDAGSACP